MHHRVLYPKRREKKKLTDLTDEHRCDGQNVNEEFMSSSFFFLIDLPSRNKTASSFVHIIVIIAIGCYCQSCCCQLVTYYCRFFLAFIWSSCCKSSDQRLLIFAVRQILGDHRRRLCHLIALSRLSWSYN